MSEQWLQIAALVVVVVGFSGLVFWVYSPTNRDRFEAGSRLPLCDVEDITRDEELR